MLKIVTAPAEVLSQIAKPYPEKSGKIVVDKTLKKLISDMKETLLHTKDPEGVGLAAPQIGKSTKLFLAKPTSKSNISVFINPTIVEQKNATEKDVNKKKDDNIQLEGCLSLPNIWGDVKRPGTITVSYFDGDGQQHTETISGFLATIIQHEYDHLQGTLFPKRVLEQKGKLYKSIKNKKGEDEFEEMEI